MKRVEQFSGCQNLGLDSDLTVWIGKSGMRWGQLLSTIQYQMITRRTPNIIVLHLGGNDIDSVPQAQLIRSVQADLNYIQSLFTKTLLVWCDILPRLSWRNSQSDDPRVLNLKRKRINRAAREAIRKFPLGRIISPHILGYMEDLFHRDGVHLSEFGNLTYLQTLKNSIRQFSKEI